MIVRPHIVWAALTGRSWKRWELQDTKDRMDMMEARVQRWTTRTWMVSTAAELEAVAVGEMSATS